MLKIKYNNIILYFSLLLIFILSLSFVSATEENITISQDLISNSVDNVIGINHNEIYVNVSNNGYANGSYDAPYSNLNEAIQSGGDNSTIILMEGTYKGSLNNALTIDKNLTIQSMSGNVVIDGENKYGFFNILNSNSLKLYNLTFINGFADVNSKNTAIITNNGNLTLDNISFKKMSSFMGLIFNNGDLRIYNSQFSDISSSTLAQVLVNLGNASIANSNLNFKSGNGVDATLYNAKSISVKNSKVGQLLSNYDYGVLAEIICF